MGKASRGRGAAESVACRVRTSFTRSTGDLGKKESPARRPWVSGWIGGTRGEGGMMLTHTKQNNCALGISHVAAYPSLTLMQNIYAKMTPKNM